MRERQAPQGLRKPEATSLLVEARIAIPAADPRTAGTLNEGRKLALVTTFSPEDAASTSLVLSINTRK